MKAKYYVFIGQNATTGTPNTRSGLYSMYGDLKVFHTLEKRNTFFDTFYSSDPSVKIWKTNKHEAKSKFFAGMTASSYNDYINEVHSGYISISKWL